MAKKKNGDNGNGGVIPTAMRHDEEGRLIIDDLVPASVLLMFFIQKLGQATLDQLAAKVLAAAVVINQYLLGQAVEALRSRQFVSYSKSKTVEGEVVSAYKPRQAMWGGIPEVAQVTEAFLSSLVSTPEAEELIGSLNDAESEGDGTSKAKEKLRYADFYMAEVTFRTLNELIGGRPSNPHFDELVEKGPKCPTKCDLRFPRDGGGWPVVPASNIRGWLEGCFRRHNITPAAVSYIGIGGGKIEFPEGRKAIEQHSQPVVDLSGRGGGRGLPTYEAISAGATITFTFSVPKRGAVTPLQLKTALVAYAPAPVRGLSNARSNEYGRAEVIGFKLLGEMSDGRTAIESALGGMSDEGRRFAESVLDEIGTKRLSMFSGKHVEVE